MDRCSSRCSRPHHVRIPHLEWMHSTCDQKTLAHIHSGILLVPLLLIYIYIILICMYHPIILSCPPLAPYLLAWRKIRRSTFHLWDRSLRCVAWLNWVMSWWKSAAAGRFVQPKWLWVFSPMGQIHPNMGGWSINLSDFLGSPRDLGFLKGFDS